MSYERAAAVQTLIPGQAFWRVYRQNKVSCRPRVLCLAHSPSGPGIADASAGGRAEQLCVGAPVFHPAPPVAGSTETPA